MLGLRGNETVSVDRLVEGLWAEDPPATAPKMVQLYVSQLRRLLAGGDAEIVTHGRGYELRLPADAVDAARFERLVEQAGNARGRPNGVAREALSLWRGAALADVADEPFAAAEIRRLDELWLRAAELAIDGDLTAGRHEKMLAELGRLIEEHPLREHLHAQRMLALYRSGRQAEALEAYVAARLRLVEDAGIEPGAELRELHDRILRQDPTLQIPAMSVEPGIADDGRAAPSDRGSQARPARGPPARVKPLTVQSRYLFVAAAAALLIAIAVFAVNGITGMDRLPGIDENAVGVIDPDSAAVTAQYAVGRGPSALAVGGGSVWVSNAQDGTVSRINRARDQVRIPVGEDPAGLAFAAGSLWVTDRHGGTVSQIDPAANRLVRTIPVANGPRGIAAGFGAVWVASEVDRSVVRIDLSRRADRRPIDLGANPTALAAGAGALWVTSEEGGTVFRIEPRSRTVVKPITVGNGPTGVAVGLGAVWVANRQDGTVSRIDPETNAVTGTLPVGRDPSAIAVGEGAVWVANSGDGTVSRIDPSTTRVVDMIEVHSSPSALAIADGSVWTAALASPVSHRGGTLRVESPRSVHESLEPGNFDATRMGLLSLAYDGLVTYRRAGGATFGPLVGDLATEVPEPSVDGRTYVFTLRPSIRYSNGALVEPDDFRASLEDLLRRHGKDLPPFYHAIVGVPGCVARPASCDLSKGIVTDSHAGTITIHLTEPDPELVHALANPLAYIAPADRPFGPDAEPPPGTGPYRIASFHAARGARLVRNRHFRVWSRDARPDGLADEIVVRFRRSDGAQVDAIEDGAADVAVVAGPFGTNLAAARVAELGTRNPGQLHTDAVPELDFMFLNVRTPPFDDVLVRRALNYATDRRAIAELEGGPDLVMPTCQILPPGFPGYTPSCRYTLNPDAAGSWTAPDMQRARRLIDRSGTSGMRVTVWGYGPRPQIHRYFVALLHRLGYRSNLRHFPDWASYYAKVADSRARAQIGLNGYIADFAAPSNFTAPFACGSFIPRSSSNQNLPEFCDRGIEAQVDAALTARGSDTNLRWQRVYARLADAAPLVPLLNRRTMVLVSKRVGNYQHHPLWGTLLDQLWVR